MPVRPTTDFAKTALFNILANRVDFESISVLDLFCGTGNISFEFASSYDNLKKFLSDIESSLRLIDIRSIDFNLSDKGIHNYKVTTEIYWLPGPKTATQ